MERRRIPPLASLPVLLTVNKEEDYERVHKPPPRGNGKVKPCGVFDSGGEKWHKRVCNLTLITLPIWSRVGGVNHGQVCNNSAAESHTLS